MPVVESFAPIIGKNPKVLILGSMPGVQSLEAQQYYAHPRNAFWPIMAQLFNVEWSEVYAERVSLLQTLPVILWDVLKSCQREGSLDSDIAGHSVEANAIDRLLADHASVKLIAFNGATSEKFFRKHVLNLLADIEGFDLLRLPSTSPAHASMNQQQKLNAWRAIKSYCN